MNPLTYYFMSTYELLWERIHRHVYMKKLRFTISTADQLYKASRRKYYVVHDINGDPTIVTASMVNDLKAKGRLPKEWTHLDLERQSIYIPFKLTTDDKKGLGIKCPMKQKEVQIIAAEIRQLSNEIDIVEKRFDGLKTQDMREFYTLKLVRQKVRLHLLVKELHNIVCK